MSRLVTWEAIEEFINDLADVFADKIKKEYRCLGKYKYLVSLMTLSHKTAIDLHIDAFRKFCVSNREALKSITARELTEDTIKFSDSCYIPVGDILAESDDDLKKNIWGHLHVLSARTDPEGGVKAAVISAKLAAGEGGGEWNFLENILAKAEGCVDKDNDNPMAAIMSMMKGGVFTDLFKGMTQGSEDGTLDTGKLMQAAQKIISPNAGEEGADGEANPMAAMTTMMSSMMAGAGGAGGAGGEGGEPPDIMKMLGPLMAQMGGGGGGGGGEGGEGGEPPNIMKMLGPLMAQMGGGGSGGSEGGTPDIMGILGPMMGQMGGGGAPSIQDTIDIEVARARRAGKLPQIKEE